ncbi:hypothetical protein O6H91_Y131800 [Diphasiastrum complanatum]|nr:hypothetical protein O6H91_Y131800 [Diphasiastrum complanatum]
MFESLLPFMLLCCKLSRIIWPKVCHDDIRFPLPFCIGYPATCTFLLVALDIHPSHNICELRMRYLYRYMWGQQSAIFFLIGDLFAIVTTFYLSIDLACCTSPFQICFSRPLFPH